MLCPARLLLYMQNKREEKGYLLWVGLENFSTVKVRLKDQKRQHTKDIMSNNFIFGQIVDQLYSDDLSPRWRSRILFISELQNKFKLLTNWKPTLNKNICHIHIYMCVCKKANAGKSVKTWGTLLTTPCSLLLHSPSKVTLALPSLMMMLQVGSSSKCGGPSQHLQNTNGNQCG